MMAELPFFSEFLQSGCNRLNCKISLLSFFVFLKFSSGTAMVHHPNLLKQLPLKQKRIQFSKNAVEQLFVLF